MNWMVGTIVVASDGSSAAEGQLLSARALARATGARIVIAHVTHPGGNDRATRADCPCADAEVGLRAQVDALRRAGVRAELAILASDGDLAGAIADDARRRDADLIVTRRRRRDEMLGESDGDVSQRLMQLAPCPVLVVPRAG
jgi:nucleotide-binding universal stress UspA family protein